MKKELQLQSHEWTFIYICIRKVALDASLKW